MLPKLANEPACTDMEDEMCYFFRKLSYKSIISFCLMETRLLSGNSELLLIVCKKSTDNFSSQTFLD